MPTVRRRVSAWPCPFRRRNNEKVNSIHRELTAPSLILLRLLSAVEGFAAAQSSAARALVGALGLASGVINLLTGGVSPVEKAYDNLLAAYQARTLFTVYTGKRLYKNMLIKSLSTTTDKENANWMLIRIAMRQILMAQTQTVTVPDSSVMSNPASTASPTDAGTLNLEPAPNINATALA
ncbi:phage baseplate protein [Caballeronia sp. Sq4a]|uniref:phage baseplate protein n=1 Tax=Caballeronia sp. Sq4a TaxID=2878152 RepID=UPI0020BF9E7F|nr:hypothetical protein [Caballeronia sp. Sq4a]